jgi:hypothetical protein
MLHDKLGQRPYGRGPIQHVVNGPKREPRTRPDLVYAHIECNPAAGRTNV